MMLLSNLVKPDALNAIPDAPLTTMNDLVGHLTTTAASPTVDLTGIASAIIAGVFSVLAVVLPMLVNKYVKDAQARTVLDTALNNSLGVLQQEAQTTVTGSKPAISIPNVPPNLATGVQYVLDHAGDEAARFGITPQALAEKISARIGVKNIESNVNATANIDPMGKTQDAAKA